MKKGIYFLVVLGFVVVVPYLGLYTANASTYQSTASPYIHTDKTPNGVSVTMDLPNNFKGQVYTVYKDGKWQTYATSTPISQADVASIDKQLNAQRTALDELFAEQQKFLQQQQAVFQQLFNGW
jgi:hypothetical protein